MNFSRRQFLTSSAATVAVLALSPSFALAQSANQQVDAEHTFDIRNLYKEMGKPESKGPFVDVLVRMKKNTNDSEYTTYKITIDASLLHTSPITDEEIMQNPQLAKIAQERGIATVRGTQVTRSTPAFVEQFNIENYLSPEKMRQHIFKYKFLSDDTLLQMRESRRVNLDKKEPNSQGTLGTIKHLLESHDMERGPDALQVNGPPLPTALAINEARILCRQAINNQAKPQNAPEAAPAR